jgi:hypothetical protein
LRRDWPDAYRAEETEIEEAGFHAAAAGGAPLGHEDLPNQGDFKGIEANGGLAVGGFGAGAALSIAAIGGALFWAGQHRLTQGGFP